MNLTQEQKGIIKKLQKVVLANIVNCADDVRQNAIKQFKNVKFEIVSDIDLMEMGESPTVAAFFDESKNCIIINSMFLNSPHCEHILLHEMFHAYSFNGNKTGFYFVDNVHYKKNFSGRDHSCIIKTKMFEMLNESATEFYATMFSDKKMISYVYFLPIYNNLSEVCGFDKLASLYFSNNAIKMLNLVKTSFKLKDNYLVKKLFMQMDQAFNVKTGETSKLLIVDMYKTLIDMHINKLNAENEKILTSTQLASLMDINKIVESKGLTKYEYVENFDELRNSLKNYIENYTVKTYINNMDEIKNKVDNFLCDRLLGNKTANFMEYKEYFSKHLLDCILYLDQNHIYKMDTYNLHSDLFVNEFLNFMHDENKHINLSNLNNNEKELFIKTIIYGKKHKIVNPEEHFYQDDLQKTLIVR